MKIQYLTSENLNFWINNILKRLEGTRGRTKLPQLDESSVLLWLDPQKIFLSSSSPAFIPSWSAVEQNCIKLAQHALFSGRKVFVTKHIHPPLDEGGSIKHFFGRLIYETDPLSEFIDYVTSIEKRGATIIKKSRHSAFAGGELVNLLKSYGVKVVIIIGVQAHLCVLATAVEATSYDFIPVVVADAISSGEEFQHISTLESLSGGISCIMTTEEVMEKWH